MWHTPRLQSRLRKFTDAKLGATVRDKLDLHRGATFARIAARWRCRRFRGRVDVGSPPREMSQCRRHSYRPTRVIERSGASLVAMLLKHERLVRIDHVDVQGKLPVRCRHHLVVVGVIRTTVVMREHGVVARNWEREHQRASVHADGPRITILRQISPSLDQKLGHERDSHNVLARSARVLVHRSVLGVRLAIDHSAFGPPWDANVQRHGSLCLHCDLNLVLVRIVGLDVDGRAIWERRNGRGEQAHCSPTIRCGVHHHRRPLGPSLVEVGRTTPVVWLQAVKLGVRPVVGPDVWGCRDCVNLIDCLQILVGPHVASCGGCPRRRHGIEGNPFRAVSE
eukprot:m.154457 g.154457  ORF g.154457 m.154457 type:complete len:338 (+) comp23507_c2_seq1:1354-2367(+)